jgi:hypothetical protein
VLVLLLLHELLPYFLEAKVVAQEYYPHLDPLLPLELVLLLLHELLPYFLEAKVVAQEYY